MTKNLLKTRQNKKATIIIFGVFIVLGAMLVNMTFAAPSGKTSVSNTTGPNFGIYLNPKKASVVNGSQFTETVSANLATYSVQSISVYLHYDPSYLRLDSIDQSGVDPSYSVTTRCSVLDGCKPAGEAILIAGYIGTGTIQPKNNLILGKLKFTPLKTGKTIVAIDPDKKLSGFASSSTSQLNLDKRLVSNSSVSIINKKGHK